MVIASAPGKLMLFGEHAVVYGRPCIVTSVNQRMRVAIRKRNDDKILLNAPNINVRNYEISSLRLNDPLRKEVSFVLVAVRRFFQRYNKRSGLNIETSADFSSRFGLGSSSAVTVATLKGLSGLFGIEMSKKELFDLSYKTVLDIQKVGSGFDLAAATFGKSLFFVKGGKIIEPLKITEIPLVVGYTGAKADTVTLIKVVRKRMEETPRIVNEAFDRISEIVKLARKRLEEKNWRVVGELMNENQKILRSLGVSSEKLESLIKAAIKSGAYGAKLSGAGGGDCMIAICENEKKKEVKEAIEKVGGTIVEADVNVDGARIDKIV